MNIFSSFEYLLFFLTLLAWRSSQPSYGSISSTVAARNPNGVFAVTHVVDIRRRASPPLQPNFFGNACARAIAMVENSSPEQDYYNLALKLREQMLKADADYVRQLEDAGVFLLNYGMSEENDPVFREERKTVKICSFVSWWRLSAYEVDFRWGKPVWVSTIGVPVKNLIVFTGTNSGDGIEAWVSMLEEDIVVIESNYNLIG
ncbi:stemmadenine O-acetyltransferase-like [Salvia divinorum]|uniref:Stemmadenine O-acetyltransferase-like n=1 Tax=Salvia divinorum TaxID=28513 RepID=A0ABD1I5H6_SALDI